VIHSSPACLRKKKKRKQRYKILFLETEKIKQVAHKTSTKPFNTLYNCGQVQNKDGSDWLVYDDRNTAQHYK